MFFYRATPFANGASDNPDGILKRIGEGNLKMDSGNWLSVSSEAKVKAKTFFYYHPEISRAWGKYLSKRLISYLFIVLIFV